MNGKRVAALIAACSLAACLAGCVSDPDVMAAQDAIAAIGEVSLNSRAAIESARSSYDALSDEQKAKVGNADALEAAEGEWQDSYGSRIEEAERLIDAIGDVTLDSDEAVGKAAVAYHALSTDEKVYVSNRDVLASDQNALDKLKKEEAARPKPLAVGDSADSSKWHVELAAAYTAAQVTDPTAIEYFRADSGCFVVMEYDVRGTEGCRDTIDEKVLTDIAASWGGQTYKNFVYERGGSAIFIDARNTVFEWDGTSSIHLYVFAKLPAEALGQHVDVTLKILGENKALSVD